ncbi:hypothetical protein RFI_19096 [Reticulomyxa filosa]|uniref:Transmembrane protein n=1 Tax=Reticulomyxa filosa TaxID=46433 RepID=X6MXH1_RETFI|nr:hypothetical protein RFI_19096 [Reticulomyxa filosa]|eukprot:ETO18182.1 hypothetical protein RFI_19096 [Reticulomyxa filosa]
MEKLDKYLGEKYVDKDVESMRNANVKYLQEMKPQALTYGLYGSAIGSIPAMVSFFWGVLYDFCQWLVFIFKIFFKKPKWRPSFVPVIRNQTVFFVGAYGIVLGGYFGTVVGMLKKKDELIYNPAIFEIWKYSSYRQSKPYFFQKGFLIVFNCNAKSRDIVLLIQANDARSIIKKKLKIC